MSNIQNIKQFQILLKNFKLFFSIISFQNKYLFFLLLILEFKNNLVNKIIFFLKKRLK